MKGSPPVYNPKRATLKEKFDCNPAEQRKVLAACLVGHARAMKEDKMPFFASIEDPREGPESASDAVSQAEALIDTAMAKQNDMAEYCFELDYIFRLFRLVGHENAFLNTDACKLVAAAAKACINQERAAAAMRAVLDFYRSEGIGKAVEAIDNLCARCGKALTGPVSIFRGKKHHQACFTCVSCGKNLSQVSFTIHERGPVCSDGCRSERQQQQPQQSVSASSWSVDEVVRQLEALQVSDASAFRREAIDGTALMTLTEEELRTELQLPLGDRKKVLELIRRCE